MFLGAYLFAYESASTIPMGLLPVVDVTYGNHQPENRLNVYLPDGDGPFPTVLLIHGTDVNKNYFADTGTTADLTAHGYAAVSIEYRAPTAENLTAGLQDTLCALAWIYANSRSYAFDTDNIVMFGHSRGGSMATLLATRDDMRPLQGDCPNALPIANNIKAVITYGGSYGTPEVSFSDPFFISVIQQYSGLPEEQITAVFDVLAAVPPSQWLTTPDLPELVQQFAANLPLAWVDESDPPFLVAHGGIDEMAPPSEAEAFDRALRAAGVSSTLAIIPNGFHRVNQEAFHKALFKFLDAAVTPAD